jgi:hypothetical protein
MKKLLGFIVLAWVMSTSCTPEKHYICTTKQIIEGNPDIKEVTYEVPKERFVEYKVETLEIENGPDITYVTTCVVVPFAPNVIF